MGEGERRSEKAGDAISPTFEMRTVEKAPPVLNCESTRIRSFCSTLPSIHGRSSRRAYCCSAKTLSLKMITLSPRCSWKRIKYSQLRNLFGFIA